MRFNGMMAKQEEYSITSHVELNHVARMLSKLLRPGMVVYLHGELGTGKTTLVQAIVKFWQQDTTINSPTYSILNSYQLDDFLLLHMDLYRLQSAAELEVLGLRDYLPLKPICLIEWPERVARGLPAPDIEVFLRFDPINNTRTIKLNWKLQA